MYLKPNGEGMIIELRDSTLGTAMLVLKWYIKIPETSERILYIVAKVCRTFSRIFSPRLYRRPALVVNGKAKDETPVPSVLTHVRDLKTLALKHPSNPFNLEDTFMIY
ncbi:hypothetical protein BTUL_0045g00460 [Botrytis tulipae]|uniref:Uncharacterized protein n=1 Tax=Botrytis tulipae TaxID=87230 RepID=A0A4Z1ERU0_9HELO|nr:hypothetical protein BTUL_0045g00460 [Botrytis tulipae]